MQVAVVIPAYKPGRALVDLIRELVKTPIESIVVIDDGSGPKYQQLFEEVRRQDRVTLLRHGVNLGKGAALKTGINHVVCDTPRHLGVVTADADGQHEAGDILDAAEHLTRNSRCLILGSRQFDQRSVPWKSRFGNRLTRTLVRLVVGQRLTDTQTGLRAIPMEFLPTLLRIQSGGYEFELDMLIAAKHHGIPIVEHPIETIYEPGNPTSHFNPVLDSLKIYFVLLRFTTVSLLSSVLDNTFFILSFQMSGSVAASQLTGRALACCFNYPAARKSVFLSRGSHKTQLPRYILHVLCSAGVSYMLIRFLLSGAVDSVVLAKVIGESVLFIFNFAIQRDFVFSRPSNVERKAL